MLLVDWLTLPEIVQRIEGHHPDLNKLLETASEQIANNDPDQSTTAAARVDRGAQRGPKQGWELRPTDALPKRPVSRRGVVVFVLAAMQFPGSGGGQLARQERVVGEPGDLRSSAA
ncbi:MAG: hypothetical protein CM1200mP34_2630 [Verrucomicrobiales bacterium]|nr:MAG: hypothetical protein CM1200mP34_2630 [Verrucomicrobiales bacterium]